MKPKDLVKSLLEDDQPEEHFRVTDLSQVAVGDRIHWEPEPGDMDFGTVTRIVHDSIYCDEGSNKQNRAVRVSRGRIRYISRWRKGGKVINSLRQAIG